MDGNKDEAQRCLRIAEEAVASGNKERALKFIKIARRLNNNLSTDELLAACEKLDSASSASPSTEDRPVDGGKNEDYISKSREPSNGSRDYSEEHVQLIRQIKRSKDYYAILGVEKTCSVEEIRRAYRKLSLKVHPDKNKAPGAEEAFKKVCKAFKCLSEESSRRQYDLTGSPDESESNQNRPDVYRQWRRRRTTHEFFEDDFDPDEIFRSFFGQSDMFRTSYVYRRRGTANQEREGSQGAGFNFMVLLQMLPFLLIFLLAYLPSSEPVYSLHKNYSYQIPRTTEKHDVEFYVKSHDFDQNYPLGSVARANLEDNIFRDYKNMLWRYCQAELQRRQWIQNLPTPHCTKLQNLGLA